MNKIFMRCLSVLRDQLHLSTIEADIGDIQKNLAAIKSSMEEQALQLKSSMGEQALQIKSLMGEHALQMAAGQSLVVNQLRYLENAINELDTIVRELRVPAGDEGGRSDAMKFAGALTQLTNETRKLCDIVDGYFRAAAFNQHDDDHQL